MVKTAFKPALLLGLCLLFVACSSGKIYKGTSENNFTFTTDINKDDQVRADVVIYEYDDKCNGTYKGHLVDLGGKPLTVGIPENSRVVLVLEFRGTGPKNRHTLNYRDVFLRVKKNYRYEINLEYSNDIYDRIIKENNLRTGKSRIIQPKRASACKEI